MDVNEINGLPFSKDAFEKVKKELLLKSRKLKDYELLEKLRTREGFITLYFKKLPEFRTNTEAFNAANDTYYDLTGSKRYSNYNSFSLQLAEFIKQSNKKRL
jgi:hypothetical protein